MSDVPSHLKFTKDHEWIEVSGDTAVIGITNYAQETLGDLVFIELPEVGSTLNRGEEFAVVESVKAASEVYTPLGGEVLEINEDLPESPQTINDSPYDEGWLIKMKISDKKDLEETMSAEDYAAYVDKLD